MWCRHPQSTSKPHGILEDGIKDDVRVKGAFCTGCLVLGREKERKERKKSKEGRRKGDATTVFILLKWLAMPSKPLVMPLTCISSKQLWRVGPLAGLEGNPWGWALQSEKSQWRWGRQLPVQLVLVPSGLFPERLRTSFLLSNQRLLSQRFVQHLWVPVSVSSPWLKCLEEHYGSKYQYWLRIRCHQKNSFIRSFNEILLKKSSVPSIDLQII